MTGDSKNKQPVVATPEIETWPADARADASGRSPISSMDMQTFRNFLMRALCGDQDVPPSILTRVNEAAREHGSDAKKRDMEWWERYFWQQAIEEHLKAIDDLINRYNQMADWHHEQAEQARERMREAADKLNAIDEFVSGAEGIFKEKETTGKFDREKAIRLLKARGVNVDPNEDEGSLLLKLKEQEKKAREERSRWSKQYDE